MPYGAQLKFGIARQTATGSGAAVTGAGSYHHIPLLREDIGLEREEIVSQNLTGRFEQGASYDGISRVAGTIEFEPEPASLGAILDATVAHPTCIASGSLKTFVFLPRTADYNSNFCNDPYTIYKQFTDSNSAECAFDCQFSQVEFSIAQGQLLRARASVSGGRRLATGVGSLALPLDTSDLSLNWVWDAASVSYNGAGVSNLSEINVAINESIAPLYALDGTLMPAKYTRTGFREVTVNGTLYFNDRTIFNDFITGTKRRLIVTMQNRRSGAEIQSGYYPTFTIDIPQLKVSQMKPSVGGPGEVSVQFTGRGLLDPTSNYSVQMTLISTFANSVF